MTVLPIGEESATGFELKLPESTDAWDGSWPQSPKEFETLVDAFLDGLVRYAFRRLGNIHDAEDVVQGVFVRAFAERSKRKKISRVGPYLYRMVANACTDLLRKCRRSGVSLEEIGAEAIPSGQKNPSEVAAAAEEMRRAEELLRRLPKAQAEVIRLRVLDELRLNEIAEVVGCSVDTVSSRLRYGFKKLRKIVSKEREYGNELPTSSTISRRPSSR